MFYVTTNWKAYTLLGPGTEVYVSYNVFFLILLKFTEMKIRTLRLCLRPSTFVVLSCFVKVEINSTMYT